MSTSTRVTFSEYEAMVRRGAFTPREEHRVELIRGEIVPMSPIGPSHNDAVAELLEWSFQSLPAGSARIYSQGPIALPDSDSEPEPDLVWARHRRYSERHPTSVDLFLVIEVSETSLEKDRTTKASLYASAGIIDYWLVNLGDRCVDVHRQPDRGTYRSVSTFRPGQEIRPLAFPEVSLAVARIFPG